MSQTYSLWAMPSKNSPVFQRLVEVINDASAHSNSVPFLPHVTLLGGIVADNDRHAISRCRTLSRLLTRFEFSPQELTRGRQHFQCVYVTMVKSQPVLDARQKALEAFGMSTDTVDDDYMPHLSLVYGTFNDAKTQEMLQFIETNYPDIIADSHQFTVDSLSLYKTDPSDLAMKTWASIAEFELL